MYARIFVMKQELGLNFENLNKLIVVPGHATFTESVDKVPKDYKNEKYWTHLPFQRNEVQFYIEHIEAGLEMAASNPDSLLVFSGGFSRNSKWSEAATYGAIARDKCLKCQKQNNCDVERRTVLDEASFDSLQNVKNSINIFNELTYREPEHINIVGYEFKRNRFVFHLETLGIPETRYTYHGVNNPHDLEDAIKGDAVAFELFKKDPWGSTGKLAEKRRERNVLKTSESINWRFLNRASLDELLEQREEVKIAA